MKQRAAKDAMLLVFRLEGEAFAVSVETVHEVLDSCKSTHVPNADSFAPGLINVRGMVVPVVEVRNRLNIAPPRDPRTTRMIVLEHELEGAPTKLAFAADEVEEVIEADLSTLERVPKLGADWPQAYLSGTIRRDGQLIVLLDNQTLFAPVPAAA